MEKEKLNEILELHRRWARDEPDGQRANLRCADLRDANLRSADLSGANLYGANLRDANLRYANLRYANLRGADLSGANLRDANLRDANLRYANLYGADLRGADLSGANLYGADLYGAKNPPLPIACPDAGAFTAWKKCRDDRIVKLLIPEDAKRCSATTRKCRASKAVVLGITGIDGAAYETAVSQHDDSFVYKVGETVVPDSFDEDRWNECSNGIHFFITRGEAEAW